MDSIPEPPPRTQTAAPAKAAGLRILVLGLNASPEPIGIGKYSGEMMAWLAARGHRVTGVAAPPYYPAWRVWDGWSAGRYATERRDGVDLVRCPLYVPHRPGGARRLVHLMSFAASSLPAACAVARRLRPQVVVAVAPTLFTAPGAVLAARVAGAASWLHIQDFEVEVAFELGLLKGRRTTRLALSLERRLLAEAAEKPD